MIRLAVIMILAALSASVDVRAITPDSLRVLYFDEWVGKCGAEKLVEYTEGLDEGAEPLFLAYRGAALATTANCTNWPLQKISRFREGKSLLEEAVERAPQNLEVRFLRYTVQKNIPSFLGYDNLEEDRKFVLEKLSLQLKTGQEDDVTKRIVTYLYETGEFTKEQLQDLDATIANEYGE